MEPRDPRRWWILVVLCLSALVLVIDNMVLTVAVPPLAEDLHASTQDTQWILDSYILVFAGLLLTSGSLSDRFGRRKVMIIGLALFGAASLSAPLASTPTELVLARAVMGVGGALIMPSTLSILITVFDDTERRKAMAVWSAVAMLGLVGGPVLGGVLIDAFWWGAVFLINVPVAALAIIAAVVLMPESKGPWRKPDPLGAVLSATGMTALVWTIIELPTQGLTHPATLIALAVAITALTSFIIWEQHTETPMVPLNLFRNRNFSGGSVALTLVQIGNGGLLLVLTQYLQFVLGYSPMKAGLALIPLAAASLIFNTIGASLGQKISNRSLATTGLIAMAAAFAVLSTITPDEGFLAAGAGLLLLGAGGGLAMPAAISMLMAEVPAEQAGVGSALNDTIQQSGAALGVAILGSVASGVFTANMPPNTPTSIGDALATNNPALTETARTAFTSAMTTTFTMTACAVLAAAALAMLTLRDRKPPTPHTTPTPTPRPTSEPKTAPTPELVTT